MTRPRSTPVGSVPAPAALSQPGEPAGPPTASPGPPALQPRCRTGLVPGSRATASVPGLVSAAGLVAISRWAGADHFGADHSNADHSRARHV